LLPVFSPFFQRRSLVFYNAECLAVQVAEIKFKNVPERHWAAGMQLCATGDVVHGRGSVLQVKDNSLCQSAAFACNDNGKMRHPHLCCKK